MLSEFELEPSHFRDIRNAFFESGCVILRNAIENTLVTDLKQAYISFFQEILKVEGRNCDYHSLDDLYYAVKDALPPEKSRYILGIGRDFPAYLALLASPRIKTIMEALYGSVPIQTVFDMNVIRIDEPNNNVTKLGWHQEYPYNMLSQNAATVWTPLTPVIAGMGKLQVVPNQTNTILPVTYSKNEKQEYHNPKYIQLQNEEIVTNHLEKQKLSSPDIFPGDILLLHALTPHRSGTNTSNNCRWTATARFGPLMDPMLYRRNWFTARSKYPKIFGDHHPDLYVDSSLKGKT